LSFCVAEAVSELSTAVFKPLGAIAPYAAQLVAFSLLLDVLSAARTSTEGISEVNRANTATIHHCDVTLPEVRTNLFIRFASQSLNEIYDLIGTQSLK
jgi:hypothetical protein